MSLVHMTIGEVADDLGISTHTLRYYEKIHLLPSVPKDSGGRRRYDQTHIDQIKFIRRAQCMQFSLQEIKQLMQLDASAMIPKPEVQTLVQNKLYQIDENLKELNRLKQDLSQLLARCTASANDEKCPILEGIKSEGD